jgi:hypothetical protein
LNKNNAVVGLSSDSDVTSTDKLFIKKRWGIPLFESSFGKALFTLFIEAMWHNFQVLTVGNLQFLDITRIYADILDKTAALNFMTGSFETSVNLH